MGDRKISARTFLTVVTGSKFLAVSRGGGGGPIYEEHCFFREMHKHLRGSNRPRGFFHKNYGDHDVNVRWLWTEEHKYFAPEISFRPTAYTGPLARVVSNALMELRGDDENPEKLIEVLKATVVEYIDDQKAGCWDDYRPLRAPGDSEMMIIARAAQGD